MAFDRTVRDPLLRFAFALIIALSSLTLAAQTANLEVVVLNQDNGC